MSTVLHPAGPEPAQTYWVRRVAVVGVAIVVLAVAGALIANGTSSGSAVQANPSPPPPAVPTVASGTPTPSAGARASGSATPSGSTSATAKPSATATASAKASASATPKPTPTPTPEPVTCAASALRPTLTGKQQLRPRQRNTFTLSLINGSDQTCTVTVNRDNFELRIYSGSDRIWSTKDCATIVKPRRRTLEAEQAIEWKLSWNGRRSRTGCMSRPEIPRPGTYYATAELVGAEPVRLLMTLRA
jgi:hypothetical protein